MRYIKRTADPFGAAEVFDSFAKRFVHSSWKAHLATFSKQPCLDVGKAFLHGGAWN